MKGCSKKYKCTLFLTSNYPTDIDERILDNKITPKKIAIGPAGYKTAYKIIEQQNASSKKRLKDNEINTLCNFLFSNPDLLYSNADIVSIFNIANPYNENLDLGICLDIAENQVFPTISETDLKKFEREKTLLSGNA